MSTIISENEDIDLINHELAQGLGTFSSELGQELDAMDQILSDIKNNWTGNIRDNFVLAFNKKTDKLEDCHQRVIRLKEEMDRVTKEFAEALALLREIS